MVRPLILLTNDDGINSPGLAALACALDPLGDLLIVAPREQQSGTGRSMPLSSDGRLFETTISMNGRSWRAYAANASPAQAVQHGVLEIAERPLALAVSGINFGENVGTAITISGTVGAAMEAAAFGIPAMAVSVEVDLALHVDYDDSVDFTAAMYFARLFASRWLSADRPPDVDVLKIDIPANATTETPWRVTRLEKKPYFIPTPPRRVRLEDEGRIGYRLTDHTRLDSDTDAGALRNGFVAITPISLDMTARVPPDVLRDLLDHR